jgi:hypothetical protein
MLPNARNETVTEMKCPIHALKKSSVKPLKIAAETDILLPTTVHTYITYKKKTKLNSVATVRG